MNIAKQTNLINFLSSRGEKIKRVGNNEYTMDVHDSMRLSDNKFYWNSRGVGGNSVTFCMVYYGMDFKTSVAELLRYNGYNVEFSGNVTYTQPPVNAIPTPVQEEEQKAKEHKPIPYALDRKTNRAYAYLTITRNIDEDIVKRYINEGLIAQDIHGNVVFKVFNENGDISGAELSSTLTERRFKQSTERSGNGFTINPISPQKPSRVMFFESAIDTLSYYSLHQDTDALLVSMAGLKDIVVLNTLERYGIDNSNAVISTDNDIHGKKFAEKMRTQYGMDVHLVVDDDLYQGHQDDNIKDWNDLLKVSEWVFEKISRPPRRYGIGSDGKTQRLWNGKTVDQFTPEDTAQFIADTDNVLESVSDSSVREKTFAEQVDEVLSGNYSRFNDLKVCDTPQILLDVGCSQLPMMYTKQHFSKAILPKDRKKHQHGLSVEQIKKVPIELENPTMLIDSWTRNDSIVAVLDDVDVENSPIVATIRPNGKGNYEVEVNSNFITSIYGREDFDVFVQKAIENDSILYINKEKSQALFSVLGLEFSKGLNNLDSNIIIHKSRNIVNPSQEGITAETQEISPQQSTETEEASIKFDAFEFDKLIPYNMRFKECEFVNTNEMYWVTQGIFNHKDLLQFQKAMTGDIKSFYVTARDLSPHYSFDEDMGAGVLAVVTPDAINIGGYLRAIAEQGLSHYLNQTENEEQTENVAQTPQDFTGKTLVALNPPDDTVTIEERNTFGYTYDDILPISQDTALNFFDVDRFAVYLLYDDNTEGQAETREDIINHTGMFGIEAYEWEQYITPLLQTAAERAKEAGLPFSYRLSNGADDEDNPFVYSGDMTEEDYFRELSSVEVEKTIAGEQPENVAQTLQEHGEAATNFHITDESLGIGTPKEKCRNNIAAIKILKDIESENRQATPEEQEILSKYVGWGGLADVFDDGKESWSSEYAELKELLTDEEYNSARASTLNAHYTSPEIIGAMYKALANMGFTSGKILEPAMGIGNFFGMLPNSMHHSKLYGVELDSISGRIAKQLYPKANIQIKGFEKTSFTSNSFDVAIGNVPFGNYNVYDNDFKEGNLIHDYFFKKSLDKVRSGGIVAFITSKGTLDKQDNSVRKYLAERAELLGAIRLPNTAFKANAGTEVTSDIIFLRKREMPIELTAETMPEWVGLAENENGIELNAYFVNHPEMVLGEMKEVSGRFGIETACLPVADANLSHLLDVAVNNIKGSFTENYAQIEQNLSDAAQADIIVENYRNYCYAIIDDDIYYREGNEMLKQDIGKDKKERMSGMIGISAALQTLIEYQTEDRPDEQIKAQQDKLNALYDSFTQKYGLLSDKKNKSLFRLDDTAALLLSLENVDEKGKLISKADIFTKRTIQPYKPVTSVNTASEALAVSISEKAAVDLEYMAGLCSKPVTDIIKDLKGVIYKNPITEKYETAEEYLSGNVRNKLSIARTYAQNDNSYNENVTALEQVQPEDLKPEEITVQLGSTWIPVKYFEQFTYELLDTPKRCRSNSPWLSASENPFASAGYFANNYTITVAYDEYTATYGISNKSSYSADKGNVKASQTYGTERMNAYTIIENTLNGKPVRIMDYYEDAEGKKKAVLNEKETFLAQDKQNIIKQKFNDWIFADEKRTEDICRIYNEKFNSIRPREYDGSHITFGGINPEIRLKKHQTDAIAHTLYGGNTLLAHSVGAGKTFEMVASAMESKRLGLCTKSLICVPKAIVGQTAREFLQLYPTANILVPDEKDFSKENRQRFCSRIATGNYDAVIISHNQLEKIPLSAERQISFIENEIEEITTALEQLKADKDGRGFTVKQLEGTRKSLEARLEKLNNSSNKDSVITFEELGVDKLYVDEAHFFKNLYFNSKIGRNVAGINTSSISQRATDLFMKCRYLDEKTGSKGVVFATGTPISNSMTELYTMQNYLQHDELIRRGLNHFDAWASTFGETQLSLELAPEGKGYQMKTRFSKFFNLPELMSMFKEMADIKTADVLNLPVPEAEFHTVATEASSLQQDMVDGLAERARKIRNREISADVDNMLNVTNDGRKLALDQRLMNELLPDDPNSKVNACVSKVFEIWAETAEQKSTQMIFCDLSTPDKSRFNVYDDVKAKLIAKGIPENEIAFIHDYPTDEKKQKLFANVRSGNIRVLLGSTGKMGTGTNVQDKLIAAHHLDCPWRPSDLEQRNGRIIRQGNENSKVDIYNYVTKGTFDAYLYQLIENKQKFISQIMTSKSPARSAEDVDESVLSYAQIKALASGSPLIKEKMDLDIEVSRLRTIFAGYQEERRKLQLNITQKYPEKIKELQERIEGYKKDIDVASLTSDKEVFSPMTILNNTYTDKKEAGEALLAACKTGLTSIGTYRGFDMELSLGKLTNEINLTLSKNMSHTIELGNDIYGNIMRIDNALDNIGKKQAVAEFQLENVQKQLSAAKDIINEPFAQKAELETKEKRLDELNKMLTIDDSPAEKVAPEKNTPDLIKRSKEVCLG